MRRLVHCVSVAAVLVATPLLARAATCEGVTAALAGELEDVVCFESPDLTTNNAGPHPTTPPDNWLAGTGSICVAGTCNPIPAFAITPVTDRGVISPVPPEQTHVDHAVPGLQIEARVAGDPTHEARFLLRLPNDWNGKLVVAGASGTRSSFNGDFAWSDYVVQKGYAYASQNKGVLNFHLVGVTANPETLPSDPLACRLNPASSVWVHFYDNDAEKPFTEWQDRIVEAGWIARDGVKALYGRAPRRTYAVGTSNGGYQVRRAVEEAPEVFDGGVDWEGTFVDASENDILAYLPPAVANFPAYAASGYDPNSAAAQAIVAAGYPPDIVIHATNGTVSSLWKNYWTSFWEVTECQWQKRLDPGYDTYGAGMGNYDYAQRVAVSPVAANLSAFATTGKIKKPLITVAGTMDALLPIKLQARAYADAVAASRKGNNEHREAQYRLYEIQNGNHIEAYAATFPQLQIIQPHAQKAFDLLVAHVEQNAPLPPDQCVARGGAIAPAPAQPGHCANLFVP